MTDILSQAERSVLMSKVKSTNTKPERILRSGLHRLGFRYRLNYKALPGKPDLVFPKYKAVIFVHGCYWHRHVGCKHASTPNTNVDFWNLKFSENINRDKFVESELMKMGWRFLIVWECELKKKKIETIINAVLWLDSNVVSLTDAESIIKEINV
ncbi:very short patch repair endonuclease [Desulfomicrobium baculatum]|uniref:Very short patch repair endonuclease n=1 Tax=Desulfomicrobium baculatum (strain DSM 4028 / VKM B-1378 / X) TaxID=525897 RepID=C7LPG4_DESBD|nr:DNA mismatch endonuclease Vsr [Desulfomicrobium baculatum]ACU89007.1 DNA mismatch endonuclease Vsr [Desulfomicrobium baculatum DSM 4028]